MTKKGYHFVSPSEQERIRKLFAEGKTQRQVMVATGRSRSSIHRLQKSLGFSLKRPGRHCLRPGEYGYAVPLSQEKRGKLLDQIRRRQNYAAEIARAFDVPYGFVLRLAHQELRVPAFRGGRGEPLDSDFPQRHYTEGASIDETAAELAERISTEVFNGTIPNVPNAASEVATAVAKVCLPPDTHELVRRRFLESLTGALEARSIAQNQWPN